MLIKMSSMPRFALQVHQVHIFKVVVFHKAWALIYADETRHAFIEFGKAVAAERSALAASAVALRGATRARVADGRQAGA